MPRAVNVHSHGECYVIRLRPWNSRRWVGSFWMLGRMLEAVQRLFEVNHRWILSVRRCAEDPWGPTVHEEEIATRSGIRGAVEDVKARLEEHRLP